MRKSLVFLGSLVLGLCGVAQADLNDGLIAYYPFNGNANDESGNGLHFSTQGQPEYVEGISGQAIRFDGVDDMLSRERLHSDNGFTWSGWFKIPDIGSEVRLIQQARGSFEFSPTLRVLEDGTINFYTYTSQPHDVYSDRQIVSTEWTQITVIVSQDGSKKLFINGMLSGENGSTASFGQQLQTLMMGKAYVTNGPFYNYQADELRVYNRALSQVEIDELYQLNTAPRFQIIEGGFTWQEAKTNAEAIGGRLAVLDTQQKIDAVYAYLDEEHGEWPNLHIGLTDENSEGNWKWIDGSSLIVQNWANGQPDGGSSENYGFLRNSEIPSQGWADVDNETRFSYLLEILVAPPAPPVVELESFYESNPDETITIDATPTSGFPEEFYYSWTFNGFEIPSFLGGNQPTMNLIGDVAQDGTWSVIVSNSVGSTEVSFEYRMFVDNDSDGLSNYREENFTLTNPDLADSDSDGLDDPDELSIHGTDPNIADVDEDGLNDSEEIAATTDPSVADTDNDGILDGVEVKTYASNPKKADTDSDGIADAAEIAAGLDINTAESIADAVAFLTQELANRPPVDGFEEAIAAARVSGQEDVTSNPSEYDLYDAASYDAIVAQRDARPTLEQVKDGRLGSVLLLPDAAENKVKIRFSIEESDELGAWTSRTEEAEVDIPLAAGKRFFRFSVKEDE